MEGRLAETRPGRGARLYGGLCQQSRISLGGEGRGGHTARSKRSQLCALFVMGEGQCIQQNLGMKDKSEGGRQDHSLPERPTLGLCSKMTWGAQCGGLSGRLDPPCRGEGGEPGWVSLSRDQGEVAGPKDKVKLQGDMRSGDGQQMNMEPTAMPPPLPKAGFPTRDTRCCLGHLWPLELGLGSSWH